MTNYTYDALNRLAEAIDPKGGTTFYGYDANDHLTSVTDPRDLKTAYAWNGLDDQLQLASPDTGTTNRTFDAAGNVVTSTDARGNTTAYSYDALNRRTHAAFADGTSIVWHYDQGANGIGRLTKIRDVTGSTHYSYDSNGHVTEKKQIVGAVTLTTIYGYTPADVWRASPIHRVRKPNMTGGASDGRKAGLPPSADLIGGDEGCLSCDLVDTVMNFSG